VLEPTKLFAAQIEGGFSFAGSLPARFLLQTRLAGELDAVRRRVGGRPRNAG
jgi:hypothetical protein